MDCIGLRHAHEFGKAVLHLFGLLSLLLVASFECTPLAVQTSFEAIAFLKLLGQWAIFLAMFVFEKFLGPEQDLLQLVRLLRLLVETQILEFLAGAEGHLSAQLPEQLGLRLETAVAHLFVLIFVFGIVKTNN